MAETTREIVIERQNGEVVARISRQDSLLHGHCEWYDGWGDLVAYGFFRNGAPLTGTFLNWANFFHDSTEDPYDATAYCQDWITTFESCFRSESPKYELVMEAYCNGRKIQPLPMGNV